MVDLKEALNGKESKWILNEISIDINRFSSNINKISTDYKFNINRL